MNVVALVALGLGVAIVPSSASILPVAGVLFRHLKKSGIKSQLVLLRSPRAAQEPWAEKICGLAAAD